MSSTDVSEILESNQDLPFALEKVSVWGANRTSRSVFEPHINHLLAATTLGTLTKNIQHATRSLTALEIFDNVDLSIGNTGELKINVREKKWYSASISGTADDRDGLSAGAQLNLRNLLGRADMWNASITRATRTPISLEAGIQYPVTADPNKILSAAVLHTRRTNPFASSHDWDTTGGIATFAHTLPNWLYKVQLESSLRNVFVRQNANASESIRNDCGRSIKTSVGFEMQRDTRDHVSLPTKGTALRLAGEVATPLGDVIHYKQNGEFHFSLPLAKYITISAGAHAGVIFPLPGMSQVKGTNVIDRFNLAGVQNVRGFWFTPLGPRDGDDSLGGDAYWAAGLSLFFPVPLALDKFSTLRSHLFINAGDAVCRQRQEATKSMLGRFNQQNSKITSGFGLVYSWSNIRFELNYVFPLNLQQRQLGKGRLQVGFGTQFL